MRAAGKVLLATVGKDSRIQRWCSAAICAAAFAAMFATILAASVFRSILGAGKAILQARIDCASLKEAARKSSQAQEADNYQLLEGRSRD
jgi:hypothetical protein